MERGIYQFNTMMKYLYTLQTFICYDNTVARLYSIIKYLIDLFLLQMIFIISFISIATLEVLMSDY